MSFRIIGDEIEYEHHVIGHLTGPTFDTWRNRAIDLLEDIDSDRIEREKDEAIKEVEDECRDQVSALEEKVRDLETENAAMQKLLDAIDDGATCAALIAKAQAETEEWRKIAETNRAAYYEAIKPKPRKRRVTP